MKKILMGSSLIIAVAMLAACGGSSSKTSERKPTESRGFVAEGGFKGSVANVALNPEGLENVIVEFCDSKDESCLSGIEENTQARASTSGDNTCTGSVLTDADGNFVIAHKIACAGYPIFSYILSNYGQVVFHYDMPSPEGDEMIELEKAMLLTEEQIANDNGALELSGTIINAFTGETVSGATITLRNGMNTRLGGGRYRAVSENDGSYRFAGVAAGVYTAEVKAEIDGRNSIPTYVTSIVVGGPEAARYSEGRQITVTLPVSEDEWRIVLTWGEHPSDLDSHIWAPAQGHTKNNCTVGSGGWDSAKHIYYANEADYSLGDIDWDNLDDESFGLNSTVNLDVDDVDSYGPETVTITKQENGTYYYSVHHYAGNKSISTSGAEVKLYKGSELKRTFYPPQDAYSKGESNQTTHYVWDVFTLNGSSFSTVNTYRTGTDGTLSNEPVCP